MKIQIASAVEVIKNIDFIARNNINLISIRDSNPSTIMSHNYEIIDNAGLQNLLVIQFDDLLEPIVSPWSDIYDERPPEEKDIRTILEWAKQKMQENNNDFIVHCSAGISRSSAVAILVQYLRDPEKALKIINPMIHCPNKKVLELGEQILGTNDIKEPAEKLMKQYDEAFIENVGKNKPEEWNFQK